MPSGAGERSRGRSMGHASGRSSVCLLAAVALWAAAPARAAERPRIVVFGVRGEGGAAFAAQLSRGLCGELACVPADRVRKAGKLDFAAVRAERVDGVLFGSLARSGRALQLALLTTSLRPDKTWALPLGAGGRIPGQALAGLAADLRQVLGGAPAAAAPQPDVAPRAAAPVPPREEVAAEGASAAPERTPAVAATRPSVPARTPARPAPAPSPDAPAARLGALDLGADVLRRDLVYQGTSAGLGAPLKVAAPGVVSPGVRLEVTPLSRAAGRWYAGAAVFASYARSVGFATQGPAGGASHDTTVSRLELGVGLALRPFAASALSIVPRVSYRTFTAEVSPTGAIPGLPDTDLAGPRVGVDLEAPFAGRFAALLGAGYTHWLQAKDLVGSGGYFSSGSAFGLDASAGLSVTVRAPFSLRVLADYERTSYRLSGTSAYHATGATDSFLGGRLLARMVF